MSFGGTTMTRNVSGTSAPWREHVYSPSSNGSPRSSPIERALRRHPRIVLGSWPTPLEHIELADGSCITVKRDDLSGYGRGGAKTRKIETLLGLARERRIDHLITIAGNITNLAFDLVPAVDDLGIDLTLFVQDDPPTPLETRRSIF